MTHQPKDQTPPDSTSPTSFAQPFKIASRPGQLRVQVVDGPVLEINLMNGAAVTFGRGQAADFMIAERSVSKVHFSLRAVDAGVELEDLGSKNGTWYAGRPVRRITLRPGDEFWAGGCCVKLVEVGNIEVEISSRAELGPLFGDSVAMRELFAMILKLAPAPLDLLIAGETGTGKELSARAIHDLSRRAHGPFVVLDCSTLASTLADATIFGFRRGAFTGAEYDQPGLFEQAHGGTLFLDEIGELAPALQMKLLRALDRRQVTRLGEPGTVREVDVRIVAATNRDLTAEVREGRFRQDLYHRLGHPGIRLPALRERGMDVIALAETFLVELADSDNPPPMIADDAKTVLATYDWPGNVRELKAVMRRAMYICKDGVVKSEDIDFGRPDGLGHKLAKTLDDNGALDYEKLHQLIDRVYLPSVLEDCKSIRAAAERLGVTRGRLRSRLQALGLYDVEET
jgi:DNA-binding NtrC family response regulator